MQCSLKTPQLFGHPNIHTIQSLHSSYISHWPRTWMTSRTRPPWSPTPAAPGLPPLAHAHPNWSVARQRLRRRRAAAAALLFTCVPTSTSLLYWHPLLILVPRESNNQASAGKHRKLTHQKRQRVYISSPKSLRSTFTSSQPAIKQSRTTTNRRDPLWFPFRPKS